MNINEAFPSTYLKAADLGGGDLTLTIRSIQREDMGSGEMKPVVYFNNTEKDWTAASTSAPTTTT